MEPDSDEEITIMGEVEELQSKLRRAGEPVDQNFATLVMNSITSESRPSERRKKWRIRRECLQRLVDNLHANSGGAAAVTVAPAVAWIPSQQPTPDLRPVVKIDVKEENERPHKRQRIENNSYALKYLYRIYDDGSAPEMAPIHVEFVKTSVERMKSSTTRLTMVTLIAEWNERHSQEWRDSGPGSGKATNFFNNGYFTMQHLRLICQDKLPLPVVAAEYAPGAGRRRSPSPPPASCGDDACHRRRPPAAGAGGGRRKPAPAAGAGFERPAQGLVFIN